MLMLHHINDKEGGAHTNVGTWAPSYLATLLVILSLKGYGQEHFFTSIIMYNIITWPNMNCINCKFLCISTKFARLVLFLPRVLMLQTCRNQTIYLLIYFNCSSICFSRFSYSRWSAVA